MEMNTQGRLIDYSSKLNYDIMNDYIDVLTERYPIISVTSIGQTVHGRRIPMISIGKGRKSVLYVGAYYGTDWQTAAVLLRYINELCEYIMSDGRVYNCSATYLYITKTVHIIPMLNPDGVEYCLNGISEDDPMYERLIANNRSDPSTWQINARGADLRTNFSATFDEGRTKDIEPETGALRNYLMFNRDIRLTVSLFKGDNTVECTHEGTTPPRLNSIGRAIAGMCGSEYSRRTLKGSLPTFCATELVIPAIDVSSPFADPSDTFCDYYRLRNTLFLSPTLI